VSWLNDGAFAKMPPDDQDAAIAKVNGEIAELTPDDRDVYRMWFIRDAKNRKRTALTTALLSSIRVGVIFPTRW
jgi:hypothetical protein